jgi:hypothetical protein
LSRRLPATRSRELTPATFMALPAVAVVVVDAAVVVVVPFPELPPAWVVVDIKLSVVEPVAVCAATT